MFAAVLDTSVLWPSLQRDFLLSMAVEGLYRPLWSEAILEELERHEARKLQVRHGVDASESRHRAERLIETMRGAFDDAIVVGWEGLDGSFGLPDPDDEHVVAAAVVGGAGAIVTANLRDFPMQRIPSHLQVLPPAEFAADCVSVDPERAVKALGELARRRRRGPQYTLPDLLNLLVKRYRMGDVVELLGPIVGDEPLRVSDRQRL